MVRTCRLSIFGVILSLLLLSSPVYSEPAEDHWSPDVDLSTWQAIADARELIESEKYSDALILLKKLEQASPENAEVHNLLGYAYRKTNEFERSSSAYEKALLLNPNHKGALEYQGELYLALGQVNKAIDNLVKLKNICPVGCAELEDLENEIAEWRDNQ